METASISYLIAFPNPAKKPLEPQEQAQVRARGEAVSVFRQRYDDRIRMEKAGSP